MYKLCLIIIIGLTFSSCRNRDPLASKKKARCIEHDFLQGSDNNLYGKSCVEERYLFIKTDKQGIPESTSVSINPDIKNTDALRTQKGKTGEKVDFINKVYQLGYKISLTKGDYRRVSFLHEEFFSEKERFFGSPDTQYKIVFQAVGNYLVVYKAAKELDSIPYIERTSLEEVEDPDGYNFRVHFIGYPIEYCYATPFLNDFYEETKEFRPICTADKDKAEYFKLVPANKQVYEYHYAGKKDLFPEHYFTGEWFYAEGVVDAPLSSGERSPMSVNLITFEKTTKALSATDIHQFEETNKQEIASIPVIWKTYESDKHGELFQSFGERISPNQNPEANKQVQLDLTQYLREDTGDKIIDILVAPDYFSMILQTTKDHPKIKEFLELNKRDPTYRETFKDLDKSYLIQYQVSFLKKDFVDNRGFSPRRWFRDINSHHFGIMGVIPNIQPHKLTQDSEEDIFRFARMAYFNINNNEPILWYFSKNSTKDHFYRKIAQEAVEIYNQAFKTITEETDKHVEVKLVDSPGAEKDLGDLRYNVLNFVNKEFSFESDNKRRFILNGVAPSYIDPYTGQTIGGTANIFIHNTLVQAYSLIRDYIRYEVFQNHPDRPKNFLSGQVISPYLETKIKAECPEVQELIDKYKPKAANREITPREPIPDRAARENCGQTISRDEILALTLHEMGHNFGLAHNFAASYDKQNYYKSIKDINTIYKTDMNKYLTSLIDLGNLIRTGYNQDLPPPIQEELHRELTEIMPKTSSVMDYLPDFIHSPLTVLGKYDLAALKFLYLSQVELKNGGPHTFPTDLEAPPSEEFLKESKRPYLHCSDSVWENIATTDIFTKGVVCLTRDIGSTPLEIIEFTLNYMTRVNHRRRIRYNKSTLKVKVTNAGNALSLYAHWVNNIKNTALDILNIRYRPVPPVISAANRGTEWENFPQEYKHKIEGYANTDKNSEFAQYFAIREPVFNFIMDLVFETTLKCQLQDSKGKTRWVDLELIKNLAGEQRHSWYVKDCFSEDIRQFLSSKDLTVIKQEGVEDFYSYYSNQNHQYKKDINPLALFFKELKTRTVVTIKDNQKQVEIPSEVEQYMEVILNEPDFFDVFIAELRERILNTNHLYTTDLGQLSALYHLVGASLVKNTRATDDKLRELWTNNLYYYVHYDHFTPLGFKEKVEKHLTDPNLQLSIEDLGHPFLVEPYREYEKYKRYTLVFQELLKLSREDFEQLENPLPTAFIEQLQTIKERFMQVQPGFRASLFNASFHNFLTTHGRQIQWLNNIMGALALQRFPGDEMKYIPSPFRGKEDGPLQMTGIPFIPITTPSDQAKILVYPGQSGIEIIIPKTPGSLIEEMIQKYNANQRRIRAINAQEHETFLEQIEKHTLEEYNGALFNMITKREN